MENTCAFPPCAKEVKALGWCQTHYLQHYHGRPMRMVKKRYPSAQRDERGHKWCHSCEQWLDPSAFAFSHGKGDGLQSRCRGCNAAIYRARSDVIRDKMRQQRFGLTRDQFDALFATQGQVCAICGANEPGQSFWSVDHDHGCCPGSDKTCGRCVRGILCGRCNIGIGHLRDDPDTLRAAADYLERRTSLSAHSVRAL